jgi:hypothetical protein
MLKGNEVITEEMINSIDAARIKRQLLVKTIYAEGISTHRETDSVLETIETKSAKYDSNLTIASTK